MSNEVFIRRRAMIAERMKDDSVLFMFAGQPVQRTEDQDYHFAPNRNFYYMTGLEEATTVLMISKVSGKVTHTLFVPRPDPYQEKYFGKMKDVDAYQELTGVDEAYYLDKMDWNVERFISRNPVNDLYMDFTKRNVDYTVSMENAYCRRLVDSFPYLRVRNIRQEICNMRRFKDATEIANMRKAIEITGKGIEAILRNLKEGVWEYQLQAHFEFALKYYGAMGNAFYPIIAGGKNSVYLHYEDNNQQLHNGDLLLLDLGAEYNYYAADISRTFPVGGHFSERQAYYYQAVLDAQNAVIDFLKPGVPVDETVDVVNEVLADYALRDGLIKEKSEIVKYFSHGVSHYIGLDTHDVGDRNLLQPGMVVSMEPGIYIPEEGIGIRIEDDALITETGCEVLSADLAPKTIEEIEKFLAEA